MTTHSRTAISVSDNSSAAEFIEWIGKQWAAVPVESRDDAKLSVDGLMHWGTHETPPSMSVMLGIAYKTDKR